MANLSLYTFVVGAILLLLAFGLHVVHATLLANVGSLVALRRARLVPAGAGASAAGGSTGAPASGTTTMTGTDARASGARQGSNYAYGSSLASERTAPGDIAIALTWVSGALIGISMLLRAIIVGRGPWGNMYEFSIAFAFGIVSGYLFLGRRYPIRSIGFLPLGVALFLVGYAATLPSEIEPLVPALDNAPLLTIHVAMAMISYGIFATSFGAAVAYLAQGPRDRFSWLPSHRVLDEVAYRSVIIGFPIFATLIILGSWWASIAWGRYWGWDPKETSALVTWLIYAVYLHARSQRGWAGRPAALMLVIGFGAVLFTYFGNLFFSGLHAYSGL
jgi:cytochrome c-type biogenesis protein CcsB